MGVFLGLVCFAIAIIGILVIVGTAMRPVRQSPRTNARSRPDGSGLIAIPRLDLLKGKPRKEARSPHRQNRKADRRKDSPKYRQLLGMLNGDRVAADDLARAYGIDKAIEDLIRDRR